MRNGRNSPLFDENMRVIAADAGNLHRNVTPNRGPFHMPQARHLIARHQTRERLVAVGQPAFALRFAGAQPHELQLRHPGQAHRAAGICYAEVRALDGRQQPGQRRVLINRAPGGRTRQPELIQLRKVNLAHYEG